jgi:glycosyltransferase involved in cell wall biosynthesis
MRKLAVVITHPIQYYIPVFQLLAKHISMKVFYTAGRSSLNKYDKGFQQHISWDIPLLQGYDYEFISNYAWSSGSHHFLGIINLNAVRQIQKFKPSTLLIYGWAYLSHLILLWSFEQKITVLFRGDSKLNKSKSRIKQYLKSKLLTRIYKHVDKALYVGTANHAYFSAYGLADYRLAFAPHAIDNSRFAEDRSTERNSLRQELGIKPHEIVILFTAKLQEIKNPALLIQAFCSMDMLNTHLLIVGSGLLEQDLEKLASSHSSSNRIHFLPFQNQTRMPVIYQTCDLFCIPTKAPGETWGLAVNEAMAAGKAIIASDEVGSATDLICAENGMIFKSDSLIDLTQKLTQLVASQRELSRLGANSKKKIADWSFEKQAAQILAHVQ